MTFLFPNYKRQPIEFVKADGNYLIDQDGKSYLDFSSGIGVTNLGFNQQVQQALLSQAQEIWHTPNLYHNSLQEAVAQQLADGKDYLAFFCNSGAEANEAAIKLARKASGKNKIISFKQSFHGRTFGAMAATAQDKIQAGFGQMLDGFLYADFNDLASVKALANQDTAAVMLELVQGESGVLPAELDFVQGLADFCQQEGILLIVDEVQTGMGRTGKLYAFQHFDIEPDIFTLAKGLANGLPVGAMLGKSKLAAAFGPGSHGSTFGGNKLAMATAQATLTILQSKDFLPQVQENAAYLLKSLQNKLAQSSKVQDIRGLGYMLGIKTDQDLTSLISQAQAAGLIVLTAGNDVLRLLPPLSLTKAEIDHGLTILAEILS